ncbi:NADP-dependent oxidoreductase domain-containing protein [Lipomyces kononenkoae]|uniref:NADP-dependent oxidoreductase domain-containing protein n=1 Tax=Lipomyces kononenkoae TaxID=34357 RepID=A0ACC3SZG5_LIPKO
MAIQKFNLTSTVKLANGTQIPQIQLGLYNISGRELPASIRWALDVGYRGFDCAQWPAKPFKIIKSNENAGVLKREDIWYTTKLANNTASYDSVRRSIKKSVDASGLGYVDLFLLHSPLGGKDARLDSWRALEDAIDDGEVRMGGVSNFGSRHIEELMTSNPRIAPVVNQIEVHPFNTQSSIRETCAKHNIHIQAYSPLVRGMRMKHTKIVSLSKKYSCTPAQIFVRWSLQHNLITLPKSSSMEHLIENASIDGFEISQEDMDELDGLDEHLVTDWDPTDIN